jgi:hypothetical protein
MSLVDVGNKPTLKLKAEKILEASEPKVASVVPVRRRRPQVAPVLAVAPVASPVTPVRRRRPQVAPVLLVSPAVRRRRPQVAPVVAPVVRRKRPQVAPIAVPANDLSTIVTNSDIDDLIKANNKIADGIEKLKKKAKKMQEKEEKKQKK